MITGTINIAELVEYLRSRKKADYVVQTHYDAKCPNCGRELDYDPNTLAASLEFVCRCECGKVTEVILL